jgi:2-C-methyl-D-erythritol 4-phosphate cytidylyltransferase/2-C-methyl-D-erythritol 2,4-cyclodiphosphate synthase
MVVLKQVMGECTLQKKVNIEISAIILAGGIGKRMKTGKKKQFLRLNNKVLLLHSLEAFQNIESIKEIIIVSQRDDFKRIEKLTTGVKNVRIIEGGKRRQDSSLNGVRASKCRYVAIHDAARPNINCSFIKYLISNIGNYDCIVPAIKPDDTVRYIKNEIETLDRRSVILVQTPQIFNRELILKALDLNKNQDITDDMEAFLMVSNNYNIVKGNVRNKKITNIEDFEVMKRYINNDDIRIGFGFDSHNFREGKGIYLGGILIPCSFETIAHSDGDTLLHSLIDAILGACAMGDIGEMFPDNKDWTLNMKSSDMMKKVLDKIDINIVNIDTVIILNKPKLSDYKMEIKSNLVGLLEIDEDKISIKAKTPEGKYDENKIEVYSQVLLNRFK